MEPCFRSPGLLGTERDMPLAAAAAAAPLVSPFAGKFKITKVRFTGLQLKKFQVFRNQKKSYNNNFTVFENLIENCLLIRKSGSWKNATFFRFCIHCECCEESTRSNITEKTQNSKRLESMQKEEGKEEMMGFLRTRTLLACSTLLLLL